MKYSVLSTKLFAQRLYNVHIKTYIDEMYGKSVVFLGNNSAIACEMSGLSLYNISQQTPYQLIQATIKRKGNTIYRRLEI